MYFIPVWLYNDTHLKTHFTVVYMNDQKWHTPQNNSLHSSVYKWPNKGTRLKTTRFIIAYMNDQRMTYIRYRSVRELKKIGKISWM